MKSCSQTVGLALLLGLAACSSPPYYPARTPAQVGQAPVTSAHEQPPAANASGIERSEGMFIGAGGVRLYERSWVPKGTPRAAFVIVHGLKDHASRYGQFAERLAARGFAVYAFDLRGHAHSEGIRVYIDSFDEYLDDLGAFLEHHALRDAKMPVFLFGHSMGGAIVTLYDMTRKPKISGLLVSGAALDADVSWFKVAGNDVVAALSPHAGVFQLDMTDFSRDSRVVHTCQTDPLVYQGAAPARMAKELHKAIGRIQEHMEDVTAPVLVMHGEHDRVTPPSGSRSLYARARSADKTLKIYPQLFHDLLHEPEHNVVEQDIIAWLDKHAAPVPEDKAAPAGAPASAGGAAEKASGTVPADQAPPSAPLDRAAPTAEPADKKAPEGPSSDRKAPPTTPLPDVSK